MLLTIDVGNTHTVAGLFAATELNAHWRIRTKRHWTADELACTFVNLLALQGKSLSDITGVCIGSVVPAPLNALRGFSRQYLQQEPLVVGATTVPAMQIKTDFPEEVGADRLVNGIAARELYGTPAIVVDFGTAITFDCIDTGGDYLGGAIAPGLAIAMDALAAKTAKLPRVDIGTPPLSPIGTNTETAIKSGFLFGYGGMVEGILQRICTAMPAPPPHIIATGGMAELLAPYAPTIGHVDPFLTLHGLRLIYHES